MIWYREIDVPSSKSFIVKKELLSEFKRFCKDEFVIEKKDLYDDLKRKVESNIFLNDFDTKDKEYLKLVLGLLRFYGKDFSQDNLDEILTTDRISFPPAIVISSDESNFFVLKQACLYLSLSKPETQRFEWVKVLDDIKIVTADPYFVSSDFRDNLEKTKSKIKRVSHFFAEMEQQESEMEMNILVKPLMKTNLVLKMPPEKNSLLREFLFQQIIHPSMKLPPKNDEETKILLEHLMDTPNKNTRWFVEKCILEGDSWIDYEKMYQYYSKLYKEVYEPNKNQSTKPIKSVFEENLELLRSKYLYNQLQKNNPQQDVEDLDNEDESYKL